MLLHYFLARNTAHYPLLCLHDIRGMCRRRCRSAIWNRNVLLHARTVFSFPTAQLPPSVLHSYCLPPQPIFEVKTPPFHANFRVDSSSSTAGWGDSAPQKLLARSRQLSPDVVYLHSWPPSERHLQKQRMGQQLFQSGNRGLILFNSLSDYNRLTLLGNHLVD